MMHGDYHIKNVMLQNGETLLIDMDTLCVGHPVFEFAAMFLAYRGFSEGDRTIVEKFLGIPSDTAEAIWEKTLRAYFGTDDEEKLREISDKARIIAYTRMLRRTVRRNGMNTEEGRRDIEICRKNLSELLARTDTLVF